MAAVNKNPFDFHALSGRQRWLSLSLKALFLSEILLKTLNFGEFCNFFNSNFVPEIFPAGVSKELVMTWIPPGENLDECNDEITVGNAQSYLLAAIRLD